MHRLMIAWPALALVSLVVASAQAQRPSTRRPETLLFNRSVQEELNLTADQKAMLRKLQAKRDEAFEAFQKRNDAKGKALVDEANEGAAKMAKALDAKQRQRFKQIQVQTEGLFAFLNKEVQDTLRLTPKQKKDVTAILKDYAKQAMAAYKAMGNNFVLFPAVQKKVKGIEHDSQKKVMALLTPEQKKAWEELVGKPFAMKPNPLHATGGGKPVKEKKD